MKFFSKKFLGAVLMLSLPLAIGFAVAAIAQETEPATSNFKFQATWPTSPMGTDIMGEENPTLAVGIKYLYEWGVGLGGVAVFIALIMAGFEYITSIGNPSKMQDAFNRIRDAIIGLVILLSSYAVLNVVGINLKELKIDVFKPDPMDTLMTNCTSQEGQDAPECCKMENGNPKANCDDKDWTCKNGTCKQKTKTADCKEIIVTLKDGTPMNIGTNKETIPATNGIKSMKTISTDGKDCFDSITNNNKDMPVCNCGLYLYTKSSVETGGDTQECGSNNPYSVANNYQLQPFLNAFTIVCVQKYEPPKQ
jgi:hypothetical protein